MSCVGGACHVSVVHVMYGHVCHVSVVHFGHACHVVGRTLHGQSYIAWSWSVDHGRLIMVSHVCHVMSCMSWSVMYVCHGQSCMSWSVDHGQLIMVG